jgi:hypothetical protein
MLHILVKLGPGYPSRLIQPRLRALAISELVHSCVPDTRQ